MTRVNAHRRNRTIVRFFPAIIAVFLVTGCGTVAPLGSELKPHRTAGPALCENFGPETRCNQADSSRVSRELDRMNVSAQLGLRGW